MWKKVLFCIASELWIISKYVFHLTRQTFDNCFPDNQDNEAILDIIWTAIPCIIIKAGKQNSKITVKKYKLSSENDSHIPYLHETASNIDVELLKKSLTAETLNKDEEVESELTTLQPEFFQGNWKLESLFPSIYY